MKAFFVHSSPKYRHDTWFEGNYWMSQAVHRTSSHLQDTDAFCQLQIKIFHMFFLFCPFAVRIVPFALSCSHAYHAEQIIVVFAVCRMLAVSGGLVRHHHVQLGNHGDMLAKHSTCAIHALACRRRSANRLDPLHVAVTAATAKPRKWPRTSVHVSTSARAHSAAVTTTTAKMTFICSTAFWNESSFFIVHVDLGESV